MRKFLLSCLRWVLIRHRRVVMLVLHLGAATASVFLAYLIRFEFAPPREQLPVLLTALPFLLIVRAVAIFSFGLHRDLWRFASIDDLISIVKAVLLSSFAFYVLNYHVIGFIKFPRSIVVLDAILLIGMLGGGRMAIRIFRDYVNDEGGEKKRLLIYGAGSCGDMLLRDIRKNPEFPYEPVGFIDDSPYKAKTSIRGCPVFGGREVLADVVAAHKVDEIVICMPSLSPRVLNEIVDVCKLAKTPINVLPNLTALASGSVTVSEMRPLKLEDLLSREPVQSDISELKEWIAGRTVLVTGAGGSIGSEICRQIYSYRPSTLVLVERYENNLFAIDLELKKLNRMAQSALIPVLADITNGRRMGDVFSLHKPDIVFHAAAHKHVPLVEHNPIEALQNNILGTWNLLTQADAHEVTKFVMISTDKAVNPANIMGATKRIAERLVQFRNSVSQTQFVTVRFGNVLGSNGSVVPLFEKQIQSGGPVTVTHPDMRRYFMLIPEAVQLVLQAAELGAGGEIFVLDMGEQVKIVDLARKMIQLSGYQNHEIEIVYTGLRPGEKLYEELFDSSEKTLHSSHKKIRMALPEDGLTEARVEELVEDVKKILSEGQYSDILRFVRTYVPTFSGDVWVGTG